jgi:dipeptidyl aminopeptidase/acylaminoacyl peptidase
VTSEPHRLPIAGGALALVLHLPDRRPAPCVLACHGLDAAKDGDACRALGEALPRAGLALARFDFRGYGESTGVQAESTIASRIEDTEAVLAFLAAHPALDGRVGLLGAGLGGFVALHVAGRRPGTPVVTWNAPASLTELANDDLEEARGLGVPFALEYATGRLALVPRGLPMHLVVHGEGDGVVGLEHGVALHEQAAEPCELLVIPGGDHRLTDPAHRAQAIAATRDWFARWWRPGPAGAAPRQTA